MLGDRRLADNNNIGEEDHDSPLDGLEIVYSPNNSKKFLCWYEIAVGQCVAVGNYRETP